MVFEKKIGAYWPLIALILMSAAMASAIAIADFSGWMHYFMGLLFCNFALLKLFNVSGFADGFQMYDLIAKKSRSYALIYPFIELSLGLAYLSFFYPLAVYSMTLVLMSIGSIGVLLSLSKGLNLKCACMGTILDVPLSTVTLTEDLGMGAMAAWMLFSSM